MSGVALAGSRLSFRHRLPIVAHYDAIVSPSEGRRIADLARRILDEEPALSQVPPLAPGLAAGLMDAPSLVLEDHSEILLAHERGADTSLSYRALLLAGEGDFVAVYGTRDPVFEGYCRETLRLGSVEVFAPAMTAPDETLSKACIADRDLVRRLAAAARESGGLNIVPYMATGGVWRLAGEIANEAHVPVTVAGPPPKLARAVNDKLWFARWATEVLGRDAIPPCHTVYGMGALVARLRRMSGRYERIALKLTHSAASVGNLVLDSSALAGLSAAETASRLAALMRERGWPDLFPLQLTVWEAPLIASPSAQLWIPLPADGPPIVEGIFDQLTTGVTARFSGAVPSRLPLEVRQRIADEAVRLGTLFQALGWFGRCSFDAILVDRSHEQSQLHWVECNGRWGGVSLPMTLANRLVGDWGVAGIVIADRRYEGLQVASVAEFLDHAAGSLFVAGSEPEGAVLLSPGRIEQNALDLLFIGRDDKDAARRSEALLALLAR